MEDISRKNLQFYVKCDIMIISKVIFENENNLELHICNSGNSKMGRMPEEVDL